MLSFFFFGGEVKAKSLCSWYLAASQTSAAFSAAFGKFGRVYDSQPTENPKNQ